MIHRYSHARNFVKLSNIPLSLNAGLQLHVHIHSWKKEHKEEEKKEKNPVEIDFDDCSWVRLQRLRRRS